MTTMTAEDIMFPASARAVQARRGSRAGYAQQAAEGKLHTEVTPDLAAWLAQRDSFYLATSSAEGQPYVQHRGGPPGFLHVLDARTLAWADYRGNRQYITLGNLADNPRAFMFLMDYEHRERIKLWGRARVVEGDAELTARLMPAGYKARPEQAILFEVAAWDSNCPQHIPQKLNVADVEKVVARLQARIAELEAQLAGT